MAVFDLLHCPICDDASQGFTLLTASDPLPAYSCNGCGLGIETVLSRDPLGDYRRATYDDRRNAGIGGPRWPRFHHDTAVAALRLSQLGTSVPSSGTWVDVGCSNGAFIALARRRGWKVLGVEADTAAAEEVSRVVGLRVIDFSTWVAIAQGENAHRAVDVISFFDVVEHLLDPVGVLRAAANAVVPGGVIVVEVPDLTAAGDGFSTWGHRRVTADFTEHLWHFNENSLDLLRVRHLPGFVKVRVARPVPGRLQVVWKKDGVAAVHPDHIMTGLAMRLMSIPEPQRAAVLSQMRTEDPDTFRRVSDDLTKFTNIAATAT